MSNIQLTVNSSINNVNSVVTCPMTINVNIDDNVIFTASTIGGNGSGIGYIWTVNGTAIERSETLHFVLTPGTSTAGTYTVSVTVYNLNTLGTPQTCTFTVIVGPTPSIVVTLSGLINGNSIPIIPCTMATETIDQTDTFILTANASGGDGSPFVYQWSINGTPQPSTDPPNQITVTDIPGTYSYSITVSNQDNPAINTTCSVTVIVRASAPITLAMSGFINGVSQPSIACNSTIITSVGVNDNTLTVTPSGGDDSGFIYAWAVNGESVSPAPVPPQTIPIDTSSAGFFTYMVTVSNASGLGTAVSCSVTFHITEIMITLSTQINAGPVTPNIPCDTTISINQNDQVIITANPTGGDGSGFNYIWTLGGVTQATTASLTIPSFSLTVGQMYTYTVTVTNGDHLGNAAACQITLSVEASIAIVVSMTAIINGVSFPDLPCNSTQVVTRSDVVDLVANIMGGNGTGFIILWSPNGETIPIINVNTNTIGTITYTVTVKNGDGTGTVSCAINVQVVAPPVQVTFTVTDNGVPTPNITCGSVFDVTQNDTVTLTAVPTGGTGTYTYSWSPGGQTTPVITVSTASVGTTNYTVTVNDTVMCTISIVVAPLQINVVITPTINGQILPNIDCGSVETVSRNDVVTLTAVVTGDTNVTYSWTLNNIVVSTTPTVIVTTTIPGTFVYTLIVTDVNNPEITTTCVITVIVLQQITPLAVTIRLDDPCSCLIGNNQNQHIFTCGSSIIVPSINQDHLTAVVTGGLPPYMYVWILPNGTTSTDKTVQIFATGTYTLTVSDSNVPVNTVTCTISVQIQISKFNVRIAVNDCCACCGGIICIGHNENRLEISATICSLNIVNSCIKYKLYANCDLLRSDIIESLTCGHTIEPVVYVPSVDPTIIKLVITSIKNDFVEECQVLVTKNKPNFCQRCGPCKVCQCYNTGILNQQLIPSALGFNCCK